MSSDGLYREAQVIQDRIELGGEDEPLTRESSYLASEEFRRLADELRSSWASLAAPPTRRRRRE